MTKRLFAKQHIIAILIGITALIPGIVVYVSDRPPGSTYFLNHLPIHLYLPWREIDLFGQVGYVLPDFIHVFSFSLITAGVSAASRPGQLWSCAFWVCIDSLFEVGQGFSHKLASHIPPWFDNLPILENTAAYFRNGTFDWLDLVAIFLGGTAAFAVLRVIDRCTCRKQ